MLLILAIMMPNACVDKHDQIMTAAKGVVATCASVDSYAYAYGPSAVCSQCVQLPMLPALQHCYTSCKELHDDGRCTSLCMPVDLPLELVTRGNPLDRQMMS